MVTFSITLSIVTVSITHRDNLWHNHTQHKALHNGTRNNDIKRMRLSLTTLSIMTLSIDTQHIGLKLVTQQKQHSPYCFADNKLFML
jgi:hypothetical protein